jgi:hypothetical protein
MKPLASSKLLNGAVQAFATALVWAAVRGAASSKTASDRTESVLMWITVPAYGVVARHTPPGVSGDMPQNENAEIAAPDQLACQLEKRMQADFLRMDKWRRWHRLLFLLYSLIIIAIPAILASGVIAGRYGVLTKSLLLLVTLAGALNAAFKPTLHSALRRSDMNTSRELFDRYRGDLAGAAASPDKVLLVYRTYVEQFGKMYSERGKELTEATLDVAQWKKDPIR